MKNGLLLGLDGAGKTRLLQQLTLHLLKSHRSVKERLLALAHGASCLGVSATDVLGPRVIAGSSSSPHAQSGPPASAGAGNTTPTTALLQALHYAPSFSSAEDAPSLPQDAPQPTVGVEHTPLTIEGKSFSICEVGGQLLPMWKAYFDACDFWIFVVDISSPSQLAGAAIEFFNIMAVDAMRRKPKLLLLNKMDACFTVDDALLRSYLCLDRLMTDAFSPTSTSGPMHVLKISAISGENADAVLKWIVQRANSANNTTSIPHSHHGPSTSHVFSGRVVSVSRRERPSVHPVAHH